MKAVAITDHRVMCGVPEFCEVARREGIKPIIGCELNITDKSRTEDRPSADDIRTIVLLAENSQGYRNLVTLVSKAHMETKRPIPCIDLELLAQHTEGLIGLSAWKAGLIVAKMNEIGSEAGTLMARKLGALFGKDNFFIEIQNHGLKDDAALSEQLVRLAQQLGLPLVATNDVHYVRREHAQAHRVLRWLQNENQMLDDVPLKEGTDQFYLKSGDEMRGLFGDVPLQNTLKIADRCGGELLEATGRHFPAFPVPVGTTPQDLRFLIPEGTTSSQYLRMIVMSLFGFAQPSYPYGFDSTPGYPQDPAIEKTMKAILDRVRYELDVIEKAGLSDVFLVAWDCVEFAWEKGIRVGPGCGPLPGSMVAFKLGMVETNPLTYGLMFERLLNPANIKPPDICIDFCAERIEEVLEHVKQKYGLDRVAHIGTFAHSTPRSATRDAIRALGLAERIPELLVDMMAPGAARSQSEAGTPIQEVVHNLLDIVGKVTDFKTVLEGLPRDRGTDAIGLVISDTAIADLVPLYRSGVGEAVTQYDYATLQKLGFIKLGFLGRSELTTNHETARLIEEKGRRRHVNISLTGISLEDSATFDLVNSGNTEDVSCLDGSGIKDAAKRAGVHSIDDLAVLLVLHRPGRFEVLEEYIRRKTGQTPITYENPLLQPILRETCGLIVYEEQFDRILFDLAGDPTGAFDYSTLGETDRVREELKERRIIPVADQLNRFADGCVRKGTLTRSEAMLCFETLLESVDRCTGKGCAIADALRVYQCAYLKAHIAEA
jgi:DNA polymerase-3 subunit alpha